jgi:hypothetical protein
MERRSKRKAIQHADLKGSVYTPKAITDDIKELETHLRTYDTDTLKELAVKYRLVLQALPARHKAYEWKYIERDAKFFSGVAKMIDRLIGEREGL